MALYLSKFSYTPETWARMIRQPEDRRKAAESYIESVGGRLHGAVARLRTGPGGGVPGGPLRIGHVRGRRRLTDALGGLPGPGLLEL